MGKAPVREGVVMMGTERWTVIISRKKVRHSGWGEHCGQRPAVGKGSEVWVWRAGGFGSSQETCRGQCLERHWGAAGEGWKCPPESWGIMQKSPSKAS